MFRCTTPTDSVQRRSKARRRSRRLRLSGTLTSWDCSTTSLRLNFHPHLPHYELTPEDTKSVHVLARQPIDLDRPHPFTAAGNTEFNCLLWMPPNQQRAGDIVLLDSTNFTTLFGGTDSLKNLWRNFALMN